MPQKVHIGFSTIKPIIIITPANFDLPSKVKKWSDEIYELSKRNTHDTYIILEAILPMEDLSSHFKIIQSCVMSDVSNRFEWCKHIIDIYANVLLDANESDGVCGHISEGKMFYHAPYDELDYLNDEIKSFFGK